MERFLEIAKAFDPLMFERYQSSDAFDIFLLKDDARIELAVLRELSKPHYHKRETAYFLFLDMASLQLGGCLDRENGYVTLISAVPGNIYPVTPFMLHAAGPNESGGEVRLLIFNESEKRERNSSAYPDDTFFPKTITTLN